MRKFEYTVLRMHIIQRLVEQGRGCEFTTCSYNIENADYPVNSRETHKSCFAVRLRNDQTEGMLVSYILKEFLDVSFSAHLQTLANAFEKMETSADLVVYFPDVPFTEE